MKKLITVLSLLAISYSAEAVNFECSGRLITDGEIVKEFNLVESGDDSLDAEINNHHITATIAKNGQSSNYIGISINKNSATDVGAAMVFDVTSLESLQDAGRLNEPTLFYKTGKNYWVISCKVKGSKAFDPASMFK